MPPLKTAYELKTQNANISLTAVFIQTKTKAKTDVSALCRELFLCFIKNAC